MEPILGTWQVGSGKLNWSDQSRRRKTVNPAYLEQQSVDKGE